MMTSNPSYENQPRHMARRRAAAQRIRPGPNLAAQRHDARNSAWTEFGGAAARREKFGLDRIWWRSGTTRETRPGPNLVARSRTGEFGLGRICDAAAREQF